MAETNPNSRGGFTPRTKGGNNRKFNKDGVLTLVFIALIAIIIIVLIIFLVKALTSSKKPTPTDSTTTSATTAATTSASGTTQGTTQSGSDVSGFDQVTFSYSEVSKGSLIVIDDVHSYITPAGDDNTLVSLYNQPGFKESYRLRNARIALRAEIVDSFSRLMSALKNKFRFSSMYGDYLLIQNAATVNDPNAVIDYNDENSSGYSFDIRVYITASGKNRRLNEDEQAWLAENCQAYGFVLRYEEGKEDKTGVLADLFHFRYVGIPHSMYMKQNNMCLEEYVEFVKNYSYSSPLTVRSGFRTYSIYYVAATGASTRAYVPAGSVYTVSGNNIDGYIITVEK